MVRVFCVVWVIFAGAGCVQPEASTCNGRTCPAGKACDEVHTLCVDPEQLSACNGKGMFDSCSTARLDGGTCLEGVCLTAGCGNGVEEPTEACDDENTQNGDGCSADCMSEETCGNGIVDPINGEACDDANSAEDDNCHTDCRVPFCGDGIRDAQFGEACDNGAVNALAPDAQCRPNCQPQRCGDGVLDRGAGEICDDGNLVAGDGCTPDCLSDETCRNDYLDYFAGETCDDGNAVGADGCSPVCRIEAPAWGRFEHGSPVGRMVPAMAYDPVRDRVVLFGGSHPNTTADNSTWELVDTTWVRRYPDRSPPANAGAQLVYDADRRVMVLFGGYIDNETWTWDGTNWKLVASVGGNPPPRTNHAMAYDPIRKRVVMVGGGIVNEQGQTWYSYEQGTWEWDGSTWTYTSSGIGSRVGHTLTFDPIIGKVVAYGGSTDSSEGLNETFAWDGTSWDDITDGTGPSIAGMTLVFDPSIGTLVLAGGFSNTTSYRHDAGGWVAMSGTTLPARAWSAIVARPTRGDLIAFGGGSSLLELTPGAGLAETWRHTGSGWSQLSAPTPIMATHVDGAMSYDVDRGAVIAFGGHTLTGSPTAIPNATWELREGVWTSSTPTGSPIARSGHVMVYDEARRNTILFGGISSGLGTHYGDTCIFDSATWSCSTPSTTPAPRRNTAIAYDANRKRTVLYGGTNGTSIGNFFGDTWEWNGSSWQSMSPTVSPGPRGMHALGYDPRRQRIVLYGGSYGGTNYYDTWEYNGTTWSPITTNAHPRASSDARFSYDAARGTLLLFGGRDPTSYYNDVWEWDGATWRRLDIQTGLPALRSRHQQAYDPITHATVMTSGSGTAAYNDSWQLRFSSSEGSLEWCRNGLDGDRDGLVGCADPDCWGACTPHCPPQTTCDMTQRRCGDGTCSVLETSRLCPADCGAAVTRCGDFVCDAGESCPGDCL